MISSKVFERWLISITDIPTLGSDSMSRCASSKTGTGKTAGPALKLKIRSLISLGEGVRVLGVGNAEAVLRLLSCEFLSNLIHRFPTPYTQNPTPYPFSVCDRSTA